MTLTIIRRRLVAGSDLIELLSKSLLQALLIAVGICLEGERSRELVWWLELLDLVLQDRRAGVGNAETIAGAGVLALLEHARRRLTPHECEGNGQSLRVCPLSGREQCAAGLFTGVR